MDEEIVVTGRRLPEVDWSWVLRDWAWTGFSSFAIGGGGGGGSTATVASQVPTDTTRVTIVIPATADRPRIELKDLTKEQAEKVMDFLDRLAQDPRLAAALDQMADRGVTLKITFADQLPDGAHPTARATVQFPILLESDFHTEGFQNGSTVTITIDRDQINNSSWDSSLEGILSHEFTHFYRDSDGQFLRDSYHGGEPGNSVQDFDHGVYQGLYGGTVTGHYTDSFDIVYGTLTTGQTVSVTGTAGNNLFEFQNDMSDATVYTGAGNDFVFTMDGNDWITADLPGVKAVYDRGPGIDVIDVFLGYFEVKLTMVNSDLYITSRYSAYSPVEDPNAVILMDHSFSDGQSIEYLRTAGGWLVELSTLWSMQSPTSSPSDAALQSSGQEPATPFGLSPGILADTIASAYAAGTVLTVQASGTDVIPEHLRHLVGGTATMTTFDLVRPSLPPFGDVGDSAFALAEPGRYSGPDVPREALTSDAYLAQIAIA
jgi:hypothetical protein